MARNPFDLSMPVSDIIRTQGWAYFKQPAVCAVICKNTGRMYICNSTRPDRRRAVMLHWLQRYWTFDNANSFFGCVQLGKDIRKYGVGSFYIDILKSMPGATNAELDAEQDKIVKGVDEKLLYNLSKGKGSKQPHDIHSSFYELDSEYRDAIKKLIATYKKVVSLTEAKNREIAEFRRRKAEIIQLRKSGQITCVECDKQIKKAKEKLTKARDARNYADDVYFDMLHTTSEMKQDLIKKYSSATGPTY